MHKSKYSLLENMLFPPSSFSEMKLRGIAAGKTILITGASSGIGESLAYMLADTDSHLILVARREDKLARIKADIQGQSAKVSIYRADLRDQEQMEGLLNFLHQQPEGLDFVVSNAGISIRRSISESLGRYHDFSRTMAINYFAPVKLLLSVIPLLKKSQGQIINISTVNVLLPPLPRWAAYQASKAAFDTWLRSAAPELNAMGIATSSVYLPLVKTPMIQPTPAYAKKPAMCPDHVARIIGKLMYSRRPKHRPWWLFFCQLISVLLRGIWEKSLSANIGKHQGKDV